MGSEMCIRDSCSLAGSRYSNHERILEVLQPLGLTARRVDLKRFGFWIQWRSELKRALGRCSPIAHTVKPVPSPFLPGYGTRDTQHDVKNGIRTTFVKGCEPTATLLTAHDQFNTAKP